jgi:hypothetical protein
MHLAPIKARAIPSLKDLTKDTRTTADRRARIHRRSNGHRGAGNARMAYVTQVIYYEGAGHGD